MSTLAVVGAGPGLGLALARVFGRRGHDVALLARSPERLEAMVATLADEGITARGFEADVVDRPGLTQALAAAAEHFDGIDVLEFSPVGSASEIALTTPTEMTAEEVTAQLEVQLLGAITAARAVLPAMRDRGAGTLLFTTGAGSINPVPAIANVNTAAAALRNWAINLHAELSDTGVYAAHVAIDVSIDKSVIPGFPVAPASDVAAAYWRLHEERRDAELVFTAQDGGSASTAEQQW